MAKKKDAEAKASAKSGKDSKDVVAALVAKRQEEACDVVLEVDGAVKPRDKEFTCSCVGCPDRTVKAIDESEAIMLYRQQYATGTKSVSVK